MEYSSNRKSKNNYEKDIEQYQQQQDEFLNTTFNKLYRALTPGCPSNYSLPQNFQNLLKRILSTNFSVLKNEESVIVNSLFDKVSKSSNFNQDLINKFQYLYSKLTKKRALTKRWGILYILNSLSKNNYMDITFSATNELQQNYMNMNSNPTNKMVIDKGYPYLNSNSTQKINNNLNYMNELSHVTNINERFYDNQNLMNNNRNLNNNNQEQTIVINPNKTTLVITEKDIINDLLFVFEGINGKYIAYDAAEDAYKLNKLIPWSEEITNIVSSLCEIGWLYKKIKLYLDYFKETNIQSQFIKSFIYSIQNELNDYFKLISFLRKLNSNEINLNNERTSQNLNLKNIVLWTLVPKETLKWIAACCQALHSLKGTSALSQIYSFVHYGGCKNYLDNILNEVSKPFINFIINWIKYGELQDTNKEFFVEILDGIKPDDIWNLQYQLIGKNVPNFMKREPTIKIFEVGKCIHFIRNYCQENYNLSNLKRILINLINKHSKLKSEQEQGMDNQMDLDETEININSIMNIKENNQLEERNKNNKNNGQNNEFDYGFDDEKIMFEIESYHSCLNFIDYIFDPSKQEEILNMPFLTEIIFNIDVIHKLINKDLVRIIFTKFKFFTNLESINKYLLLGQGDMAQTLMESLFEELDKPANLIFKHNLQSNLESAIRASNAQYNDSECLKKLNIKLNSASVGDIGWDIFCLEYKVDLPLSIIFSNKLLKDYQKLFFYFWKIKRIEYSQNNHIWKNVKTFNQFLNTNEEFMKKSIEISIHFNQEIIHFISNFHNYLALEVLETQYKKLVNELPKVNNLDELITKHKNFLSQVKKQCLLDEDNIAINKKISNIFDIIIRFRAIHDVLYNFLVEHSYENFNDKLGGSSSYINQSRMKNIKDYVQQITVLYKDFQNQTIELINTIRTVGKSHLDYLPMKLDYNLYYTFLEKDEEDRKNQEVLKRLKAEEDKQKIINESNNNIDNDDESNIINDNDNINNQDSGNNSRFNQEQNDRNINQIDNTNRIDEEEGGNENIEEDDMDIDKNNLVNSNLQGSRSNNNFSGSNNNIQNNMDRRGDINTNNSELYVKNLKYNNYINSNLNDNLDNNPPTNTKSKSNVMKITTKQKEKRPLEGNNQLNEEISDYNNINKIYKTQKDQKTYLFENNAEEPGMTYNYKSQTKLNPEAHNMNLEDDDEDEDRIETDLKPKVYGVTTRTKARKNDDNNK